MSCDTKGMTVAESFVRSGPASRVLITVNEAAELVAAALASDEFWKESLSHVHPEAFDLDFLLDDRLPSRQCKLHTDDDLCRRAMLGQIGRQLEDPWLVTVKVFDRFGGEHEASTIIHFVRNRKDIERSRLAHR